MQASPEVSRWAGEVVILKRVTRNRGTQDVPHRFPAAQPDCCRSGLFYPLSRSGQLQPRRSPPPGSRDDGDPLAMRVGTNSCASVRHANGASLRTKTRGWVKWVTARLLHYDGFSLKLVPFVRHAEAVSGESCGCIGCLAQSHRNGHVCDPVQTPDRLPHSSSRPTPSLSGRLPGGSDAAALRRGWFCHSE